MLCSDLNFILVFFFFFSFLCYFGWFILTYLHIHWFFLCCGLTNPSKESFISVYFFFYSMFSIWLSFTVYISNILHFYRLCPPCSQNPLAYYSYTFLNPCLIVLLSYSFLNLVLLTTVSLDYMDDYTSRVKMNNWKGKKYKSI